MPDYRMAKPETGKLIREVIAECDELEDYREHPPEFAVVEVLYEDDSAFDKAIRKKVGKRPVRVVQVTDHALRLLTSEQGIGRAGTGLDFIFKMDPASWDPLPDVARQAYLFDALISFFLEREEDPETGDQTVKMDGEKPRWRKRTVSENHPETFRRFGPWSSYTQAILDAIAEKTKVEIPLFPDWHGKESLAAVRGEEEPDGESLRDDVGEEANEPTTAT